MFAPCPRARRDRLTVLGTAALLLAACAEETGPPVAAASASTFAGSDACASCHAAEFAAWGGSHHQLAMQPATETTVLGDFSGATLDHFGATTRFLRDADAFIVRTAGADGEPGAFRVRYVFGVEPLQQYLVDFPGGRLQALPYAWDTRVADAGGQRWFHLYPDEPVPPGDVLHWTGRLQNWNFMCAECHSTNVVLGYDAAGDRYDTTFSEISVGCEACHGPGSAHIAQAATGTFTNGSKGLVVDLDDQGRATWDMNPVTGIAERSEMAMRPPQQPESCGRCHARRGVLTDAYVHGRPLADTHMPALLDEDLYFADGQIRDEVYVYGSFIQSRMYRAGVTCSNCHEPHSLALRTGPDPDAVCAQCHLPDRFAARGHTGHAPGVARCVDCHMPERTYMVVDPRRDHGFRVPRPDLAAALGVPQPCADCHADRDAAWASEALVALHGPQDAPTFAPTLARLRGGAGNAMVLDAVGNDDYPGVARATALGFLGSPLGEPEVAALDAALDDADALVRIAAVRLLRFTPPDYRLPRAERVLGDPVRGVRVEAAMAYADLAEMIPQVARSAFTRATRDFLDAQRIQLDRPEAWVALADHAAATDDFGLALERYEHAIRMEPRAVRARVNMADTLRRAGDDERGRRVLEEGVALEPDAAALHHSLGLLYVRQREMQNALASLERAVALEPGNARYRYVLDVARSELGQAVPD